MSDILIPSVQVGIEFHADRTDKALKSLLKAGYKPVFMPQLIDAKIVASNDSPLWSNWYLTPSVVVTGANKDGNPAVVFAHIPNYFSNPSNITGAINQGLVNYAGRVPEKEFQRLLDLEDGTNVFVLSGSDYNAYAGSSSGVISLKDAITHPMLAPFAGGLDRAGAYLEKHSKVRGNNIGLWHSDDLNDEGPLGRLLFVGGDGGLGADYILYDIGRFVGVRGRAAEGGVQNHAPSLEQVIRVVSDSVPPRLLPELQQRLGAMYE